MSISYRPEIDGLRAIAVMSVVIFHADLGLLSGGFLGVDVFYVISGYLITSILVQAKDAGTFSLRNFYERRARRILPPLLLVVALSILPAWMLLHPIDMKDYAQSIAAVVTFTSNILFYLESDYFAPAAHLKPLLHTWSLAVEEQYYLIMPLLLLVGWRLRSTGLMVLFAVLAAASLILAFVTPSESPAAFFLLPARAWELLTGSLLATGLRRWPLPKGSQTGSLAGLLMIGIAVIATDESTGLAGLPALLPVLGTALIIACATPGTLVYRLLASRPFVLVGLASYSIYLFHQPLFAFANIYTFENLSKATSVGLVTLTILLAFLSFQFVEKPFRDRTRVPTRRFVIMMISACAVLFAFGVAGQVTSGFSGRYTAAYERVKTVLPGYQFDNQALYRQSKVFRLGNPYHFENAGDDRRVLVVGNSHAEDVFGSLSNQRALFPGFDFALNFIQVRCFADASAPKTKAFYASETYRKAEVILVAPRWNFELARQCGERGPLLRDYDGLRNLLAATRAAGKQLVVVGPSPEFPQSAATTLSDDVVLRVADQGGDSIGSAAIIDRANALYFKRGNMLDANRARLKAFAAAEGLQFLDKRDYVCDTAAKRCAALSPEGRKTIWDYGHYTLDGARYFGRHAAEIGWLDPLKK